MNRIETEDQFKEVMKKVDYYFGNEPPVDSEQGKEFKHLLDLVVDYEKIHYPVELIEDKTVEEMMEIIRGKTMIIERAKAITIDKDIRGGRPVLKGTRVTIAQLLAEIAEEPAATDIIALNRGLDPDMFKQALVDLALMFDKNFS